MILAVCGHTLAFWFFGWRVDVNEFSLHGFYRNRLARCYLGGTNPKRTPDPFTGFDDHTETANATNTSGIALSELLPAKFGATDKEGQRAYVALSPSFVPPSISPSEKISRGRSVKAPALHSPRSTAATTSAGRQKTAAIQTLTSTAMFRLRNMPIATTASVYPPSPRSPARRLAPIRASARSPRSPSS